MAELKLELEIDSEVHRELYARLTSIQNSNFRGEYVRQLALMGLIWETQRHTQIAQSMPWPVSSEVLPLEPSSEEAAVDASRTAVQAEDVWPEKAAQESVVDVPSASGRPSAADTLKLPVLVEVVPDYLVPAQAGNDGHGEEVQAEQEEAEQEETEPAAAEMTSPSLAAPVEAVVRMPGTRSRLMRMKNKGLFKNE